MTCWLCGFERKSPPPTCKNGPCQICAEVAKVDEEINKEINQAAATIQRLLTKRYGLCLKQNRAHDLMHRLPLELRNYIFGLVLPIRDEWGRIETGTGNTITPPYLTSICRSWRDTALSNAKYWSTIPIVLRANSISKPNFVDDWILRSRTSPLTLHIVVHNGFESPQDDLQTELEYVLDVVSQCSNECQSLSLDIPFSLLGVFDRNERLPPVRRLRVNCTDEWRYELSQRTLPFDPKMSPEKIDICGLSFQSLPIVWNHLTSAKVEDFDLKDFALLFRHAPQMTCCDIVEPFRGAEGFVMPPIIHRRLKILSLCCIYHDEEEEIVDVVEDEEVMIILLGSLTLPSLQEFRVTNTKLLGTAHLHALMHRSSCPLTEITLFGSGTASDPIQDLQPLAGVTDLVLGMAYGRNVLMQRPLLEGYFPDLHCLTLGIDAYFDLLHTSFIHMLLDRKWPQTINRTLHKILVVDTDPDRPSVINPSWHLEIGREWNVPQSSLRFREGSLEILMPEIGEDGESI